VEETDPERLPLGQSDWSAFMNHAWLPSVARRYHTALCDQRTSWKHYLAQNALEPSALLKDDVHLNAQGEWLMGAYVKDCLRRAPELGRSPAEAWVREVQVGRDVRFEDGVLRLTFEGNRVDALVRPEAGSPLEVRIDGRKPSEWLELYGFTRAQGTPGGKWPLVFDLSSQAALLLERWTLEVTTEARDPERYRFALRGSVTGEDGEGRSDQRFVSDSGRVVIDPDDWVVGYALSLAGVTPIPARFSVSFHVVPRFVDVLPPTARADRGSEASVTLAQGLPRGRHVLELRGADGSALRALRVYRPPLL
jgi:hypothetical protein